MQTCAMSSGYMTVMTDDRYPPYHCRYDDTAGHCVDVSRSRVFTVSLYRVWIVCGQCGDVSEGEIQVRLPVLVPGLRLSSPTAALQPLPVTTSLHRAEKLTTTFLPSYHHRLGLGCICTAISSLKWLCPLCCVSGTISSPAAILCQQYSKTLMSSIITVYDGCVVPVPGAWCPARAQLSHFLARLRAVHGGTGPRI